jgi:adenosine deaminase
VATNPALIADLIARGVSLDLCPTSNVQACTVDSLATHPAAELHRRGLGITLSTDDITISDVTLSEELLACHTHMGMTPSELWACNLHALAVAFVDDVTRASLRADFTAWAAPIPELASR